MVEEPAPSAQQPPQAQPPAPTPAPQAPPEASPSAPPPAPEPAPEAEQPNDLEAKLARVTKEVTDRLRALGRPGQQQFAGVWRQANALEGEAKLLALAKILKALRDRAGEPEPGAEPSPGEGGADDLAAKLARITKEVTDRLRALGRPGQQQFAGVWRQANALEGEAKLLAFAKILKALRDRAGEAEQSPQPSGEAPAEATPQAAPTAEPPASGPSAETAPPPVQPPPQSAPPVTPEPTPEPAPQPAPPRRRGERPAPASQPAPEPAPPRSRAESEAPPVQPPPAPQAQVPPAPEPAPAPVPPPPRAESTPPPVQPEPEPAPQPAPTAEQQPAAPQATAEVPPPAPTPAPEEPAQPAPPPPLDPAVVEARTSAITQELSAVVRGFDRTLQQQFAPELVAARALTGEARLRAFAELLKKVRAKATEVQVAGQVDALSATMPLSAKDKGAVAAVITARPAMAASLATVFGQVGGKVSAAQAALDNAPGTLDEKTTQLLAAEVISADEHADLLKRQADLNAAKKEQFTLAQAAIAAANAAHGQYTRGDLSAEGFNKVVHLQNDAIKAHTEAEENFDKQTKAIALARAKMVKPQLLRELAHGPLSKPAGTNPKFDAVAPELAKMLAAAPEVATAALDIAERAERPEALVQGVQVLGPLFAKNFQVAAGGRFEDDASKKMARNALSMGAHLGGDYFDGLEKYYAADKHSGKSLGNPNGNAQPAQLGLFYTRGIASAVMTEQGVDFGSPAAKALKDELLFHPNSLHNPQTALAESIITLSEKFTGDDGQPYRDRLAAVNAPATAGGSDVVRRTLGLPDGETVDGDAAKSAVLSALMTPFRQGAVGSCFATAQCVKYLEDEPLAAMDQLAGIVDTGTFTPPHSGSPAIPVVTRISKKENALLRGWEYSVATSAEQRADSYNHDKLGTVLTGGFAEQSGANMRTLDAVLTGRAERTAVLQKVAETFTFAYDPKIKSSGTSHDGVSSKGAFRLMKKERNPADGSVTETPIDDAAKFKAAMKDIVKQSVNANATRAGQIDALINSEDFTRGMSAAYGRGANSPWDMPSGGMGRGPVEVLTGAAPTSRSLVDAGTGDSTTPRATAFLGGLMRGLPSGRKVAVEVDGVHAMNALPDHPSLAALREGGPAAFEANIQSKLLEPGRTLTQTPLPADKVDYVHDKAVDGLAAELLHGNAEMLKALRADRLTGPAKPGVLKDHLLEKVCAHKVEIDLPQWRQQHPNDTDADLREKVLKNAKALVGRKLDALVMKEIGLPKVVVADTNWGDSGSADQMVLAADLNTGEPILWKEDVYSGDISPAGDDFFEHKWSALV